VPRKLGRVRAGSGYELSSDPLTLRAPDVAFTLNERLQPGKPFTYNTIAPDLVIEIISPSETPSIIWKKLKDYFAAGTRLIWLIFPEARVVEIYTSLENVTRLEESDEAPLEGGDVLPGLSIKLTDIFSILN
jgi:Uma2 family endonuclease